MNQFNIVKIFLLISLTSVSCSKNENKGNLTEKEIIAINSWQVSPNFPCGIYQLKGKLIENSGHFKLIVREKTTAELEFLVLGGDLDERLEKINTNVLVNAYNPNPIEDRSKPIVYIREFLPFDSNVPDYKIIEKKMCNLSPDDK